MRSLVQFPEAPIHSLFKLLDTEIWFHSNEGVLVNSTESKNVVKATERIFYLFVYMDRGSKYVTYSNHSVNEICVFWKSLSFDLSSVSIHSHKPIRIGVRFSLRVLLKCYKIVLVPDNVRVLYYCYFIELYCTVYCLKQVK